MRSKKGRPKIHEFTSEEFQKLSREERQLRGRISTLRRMIKNRESKIDELKPSIMKKVNKLLEPITILENEIKGCHSEIEEITENLKDSLYNFPSFRVENYLLKGSNTYYRGVWYVDSKKKQLYLGSESVVLQKVQSKYPEINDRTIDKNLDKVLNVYLKELQMRYWKDEYENRND
jgi:seryl-tRNA synthetase